MVFDCPFAASCDDQDILDARIHEFFDDVLNGGFIDDGHHLFWQGLGRREHPAAVTCGGNDSFAYFQKRPPGYRVERERMVNASRYVLN
jgi:tRNA A37 N6-isopentenylltransferase MiaA